MSEDDGGGDLASGSVIPPHRSMPHYHGDEVRVLFVIGAILIIFAQSTGADLPLSTFGAVVAAVVLVITAGITNPTTPWIHWLNEFIAMFGTLLFGTTAVEHYRSGVSIFAPSFFYIEALTIISLIALYFTTRTIRGFSLRTNH